MPVAELLGIVRIVKREMLPIARLWNESQQGQLARVSRTQFDDYYRNQELGIGIWVGAAKLLLSSDRTFSTSTELGLPLEATAADSAINRRSDGSTLTSVAEHRTKPNRALRCYR
jgi:hypothetical protein